MSTEFVLPYLVKVTVVLALAWTVSVVLRRASAAVRHQVWASAVLAVLVLPLFTSLLPVWRVVVTTRTETINTFAGSTFAPLSPAESSVVSAPEPARTRIGAVAVALGVWAIGVGIFCVRLTWGLAQLRRLRRLATVVEKRPDGVWLLESSSEASMPMAWGWRPACVLLPAGFRAWEPERLNVVLAHELAHVQRRDWMVQIAAEAVKCLYWFHPLVWVTSAHVREESERAADDAVLLGGVDGAAYARQLLEVARAQQGGWNAALAIAGRSPIERRLRAVLDARVPRSAISQGAIAVSSIASFVGLVPFAALLPAEGVRQVMVAQAATTSVAPPETKVSDERPPVKPAKPAKGDYVLGPSDEIVISSNVEEINRPYQMDQDGFITLPWIDRVPVRGLTTEAVERDLTSRLRRFLAAPQVSVTVSAAKAATPRAFEVVSIRPNPGPWHVMRGYSVAGPTLTLEGYNLPWLITEAYGLEDFQVEMKADLPHEETSPGAMFNIAAKAPGESAPPRAQIREMLQEMLASRFHMKFHWETRAMPVYALLRGKGAIKFKESRPDTEKSGQGTVSGRVQTMTRTAATMADLARDLRNYVDRPVVDKTGLSGNYDYAIGATTYGRLANNRQPEDVDVVDAIQDVLGLRLEKVKESLPVLVVDRVEGPTEN